MIYKVTRIIAILLVIAGIAVLAPLSYYTLRSNGDLANSTPTSPVSPIQLKPSASLVTGNPVAISSPSLNMNLQVIPGNYNAETKQWNLSLDKAQFAEPSVQPNNETGNTFIYGHYRPEVFAYLHLIKTGAQATITTDNGYTFTYTFYNTQAFDPADTSIFAYQGTPRLTIQTCSGEFMQNRQMYYFSYDGYSKATTS
jgi:sortase (surface protein transpeptidase)